jgi:hypothetical protein
MPPPSEIDALFTLPPAEFTAARNALASRLRKEGRTGEAERVKALPKPPATAWAVNQLFWRHRKDIDRLLAIGEKVRVAQTERVADLRGLLEQRRKLVSDLTDRAAEILTDAGLGAPQDARRRIAITLDSLAAWERSDVETQAGRLTSDLEPLGFDGLAALLDGKKLQPANVLQFRRAADEKKSEKKSAEDAAAARARAAEAVKAAKKTLTAARRDAERAEAALARASAHAEALEEQKRELAARCDQAQEDARGADSEAKKARQTVAEAERALARAEAALR